MWWDLSLKGKTRSGINKAIGDEQHKFIHYFNLLDLYVCIVAGFFILHRYPDRSFTWIFSDFDTPQLSNKSN
jgi:hypothetical protein